MKKTLLVVLSLMIFAAASPAQEVDSYMELLRSDIKTEKMAMLTEVMLFSETEAEIFWPVYREYQFKLENLGDEYIAVIKDYADNYGSLTPEKAKDLVERSFDIRKDRLDLQKDYFKKFSKLITPVRAARWMQFENQITMLLDLQVVSAIPLAVSPAGQ